MVQVLLSRGAAVMAVDEDGKEAAMTICWEKSSQKFCHVVLRVAFQIEFLSSNHINAGNDFIKDK